MDEIIQAARTINDADAVLISASNGLSISEDFNIFANNQDFQKYFGNFQTKYGIQSILQGASFNFPPDERAAFIAQLKKYLLDDYQGSPSFNNLKQLVRGKDYFILTSNADQHFQANGFDTEKIWEIEGNFFDMSIRSPLWQEQKTRFQDFVEKYRGKKLVQLELGIGAANQLIKAPLMKMVAMNTDWSYITMNLANQINIMPVIEDRSIALTGDLRTTLQQLREAVEHE
ncbi:hypothetical protein [uncultured Limosilactobacillus sp.]|uniref:hypothetical protein n=1 Tax=uncultured Limosilactobacillus sp. TaxID=2837629 RepID=UPI0025CC2906|nr:hypothetical protein [uncultured Limosilactobacillus sp.]